MLSRTPGPLLTSAHSLNDWTTSWSLQNCYSVLIMIQGGIDHGNSKVRGLSRCQGRARVTNNVGNPARPRPNIESAPQLPRRLGLSAVEIRFSIFVFNVNFLCKSRAACGLGRVVQYELAEPSIVKTD